MNVPNVGQRTADLECFISPFFFLEDVFNGPDFPSQEVVDEPSGFLDFVICVRTVLDYFAANPAEKNLRVDSQYLDPDIR